MSTSNQNQEQKAQFNSPACSQQYNAIAEIIKTSTSNAETLERVRLVLNERCSDPVSVGGISYSCIRNPSLSDDGKNYLCEYLNSRDCTDDGNCVVQFSMNDIWRDALHEHGFMHGEFSEADDLVLRSISEDYLEFDEDFIGKNPDTAVVADADVSDTNQAS